MDTRAHSMKHALSLAAQAIEDTSSKVLTILSSIEDDLDQHEDQVQQEAQEIKERVRRGARQTAQHLI